MRRRAVSTAIPVQNQPMTIRIKIDSQPETRERVIRHLAICAYAAKVKRARVELKQLSYDRSASSMRNISGGH